MNTIINLTPRERQIVRIMIASGPSNKVMARQLSLSESTIKLHVSNIMRKFYARNRAQLVIFARKYFEQQRLDQEYQIY